VVGVGKGKGGCDEDDDDDGESLVLRRVCFQVVCDGEHDGAAAAAAGRCGKGSYASLNLLYLVGEKKRGGR